ncbi:MAG: UMP kinase [Lachnospiraceae bacterium]|nr:UMP kinase [Lachnospiraceae bacterium]
MGKYNRVLLKLSGEALAGEKHTGFDETTCIAVGKQVKTLVEQGVEVAIVIGGGNFWRGRTSETIDRVKADQIGMLATVMNCIYVSDIFRYLGLKTKVYTPFACGSMTTLFSKDEAVKDLKSGCVVFCAGGTGHPYFSTDSATSLRAIELECDVILMAKAIDGVYDSDPKKNPDAKKYETLAINEIVDKKLGVIDLTSAVLCLENKMPLLIFSLNEENGIVDAAMGTSNGTVITV